jgi:hypothetical protein
MRNLRPFFDASFLSQHINMQAPMKKKKKKKKLHGLSSVIYATQLGQSRRREPRAYGA